jgi:hypothetical protein
LIVVGQELVYMGGYPAMNARQKAIGFAICTLAASASAMSVKEALGQIETGANKPERSAADFARGPAGEISRYQLLPSVWRAYGGGDATNPTNAWEVASRVIRDRSADFERAVHRPPTPRELYVLWTAPGQFAKRNYDWQRLSPAVRERSERFANLVEVKNPNDLEEGKSTSQPVATNRLRLPANANNLPATNVSSVVIAR